MPRDSFQKISTLTGIPLESGDIVSARISLGTGHSYTSEQVESCVAKILHNNPKLQFLCADCGIEMSVGILKALQGNVTLKIITIPHYDNGVTTVSEALEILTLLKNTGVKRIAYGNLRSNFYDSLPEDSRYVLLPNIINSSDNIFNEFVDELIVNTTITHLGLRLGEEGCINFNQAYDNQKWIVRLLESKKTLKALSLSFLLSRNSQDVLRSLI
jgi:hypothetical protein